MLAEEMSMKRYVLAFILFVIIGSLHNAHAEDVVVYIRDSLHQGLKKDLAPLLKKKFKHKVIFKAYIGQALIHRLKREKKNPTAHIVLGFEHNFASQDSDLMDALSHFPGEIPPFENALKELNTPDLKLIPFCYSYFAFMTHVDKNKSPIKSFDDFLNSTDSVIIPDPRTSDIGFGFLLWAYQVYGDKHLDLWRRLKPRILTMPKGWQASYMLFLNKEASHVISYTTSELAHKIKGDASLQALYFSEGHGLQIWSLALTKKGAENKNAVDVASYLMSSEVQILLPEKLWSYPAFKVELPHIFKDFRRPQALVPPSISPQKRAELIAAWLTVMMDNNAHD
jgi:thiamine transport system substrate-binding protein